MKDKIRDLITWLNERTKEYDDGFPTVSDKEWDNRYFELSRLEDAYGIIYPDSPTQFISYEVISGLEKVTHGHDMLSLDKTKDLDEVKSFLGSKSYIGMAKMDGLTCSLRYEYGELVSAETRGNGQIGELVTNNVKTISNVPQKIPFLGTLVIDGEIICTRENFKEFSSDYKNLRNFASGSIRLLDSEECSRRKLSFIAWEVIEGLESIPYLSAKLSEINSFGFEIVPWVSNLENGSLTLEEARDSLIKQAEMFSYPIDGLVFKFNDCRFGKSLGQTGHHAKNALAFKFYDEVYETKLLDIEYGLGRTGQLTPVAIFEDVEIDGATVNRASLSNETVLEETLGCPWRGQTIYVSKRNLIIPKVEYADLDTKPEDDHLYIPSIAACPVCGGKVLIKCDNDSEVLYCGNPECSGKLTNRIDYYVGKKALDIKGLSKQTIDKLIDWGWLNSIRDIYTLQEHRDEWVKKPGFGTKSVDNILSAIESSRQCELDRFICGLGIPLVGTSASKALTKHFGTWDAFIQAVEENYKFYTLPDFGPEANSAIKAYDFTEAKEIIENYIIFNEISSSSGSNSLEGLTFVVTGKVGLLASNRDELKAKIEAIGGKVTGSVSKNTSYLINNDSTSSSSKNVKAKELGISIITEEEFINLFGELN